MKLWCGDDWIFYRMKKINYSISELNVMGIFQPL